MAIKIGLVKYKQVSLLCNTCFVQINSVQIPLDEFSTLEMEQHAIALVKEKNDGYEFCEKHRGNSL